MNATIARAAATGTITDDETPTLTIADASATEGDAVEFTVSLSPAADQAVTVLYATSDGTATADGTHEDGADYTAPASDAALIFDAGETSATITIATGDDTVFEADETLHAGALCSVVQRSARHHEHRRPAPSRTTMPRRPMRH